VRRGNVSGERLELIVDIHLQLGVKAGCESVRQVEDVSISYERDSVAHSIQYGMAVCAGDKVGLHPSAQLAGHVVLQVV
jgi:hypothetical protein